MPNNTTASQDRTIQDAESYADKTLDNVRVLIETVQELDDRLTEANERNEGLESDLKEARAEIERLEREVS